MIALALAVVPVILDFPGKLAGVSATDCTMTVCITVVLLGCLWACTATEGLAKLLVVVEEPEPATLDWLPEAAL